MGPLILALALGCTSPRSPAGPSAEAARSASSATTSSSFWDLRPEDDWMAEYPLYDCPQPDEDDFVVHAEAWSLLFQPFAQTDGGTGLLMAYSANTVGDRCAEMSVDNSKVSDGETAGLVFGSRMWFDDFAPGSLEGVHTAPRHSWKLKPIIAWNDGEVGRPLVLPEPPAGSTGDNPYYDLCLVRVRPYRVAGAWRFHAPQEVFEAYRWPEELWGGLYIWFDVRWGEQEASSGQTCFFDEYEGVEPKEVWPEMPDGWEPEQTWLWGEWRPKPD